MTSIFLSHNHKDKPFARRLTADLRRAGVKVWIDEAELQIGDSLVEKIRQGIDKMDYLAVLLSEHSVQSEWVRREVDIAMNQEISGKRVKVLPLVLDNCELPGFLFGKLFADFRGPRQYDDELQKVLRRLGVEHKPQLDFEPDTVLVPEGPFLMGSDMKLDSDADADERPQHKMHLPDYFLGLTPVTVHQYSVFVRETHRNPPRDWRNYDPNYEPSQSIRSHPVNWVSWYDAVAYCKWLSEQSGRKYFLPSEAEWEKGARGHDGRIYPWGNSWDASRCHGGKPDIRVQLREISTLEVAFYGRGVSPYGLFDMAGNVQEWTRTLWGIGEETWFCYPYDPGDGREDQEAPSEISRCVKGGSFLHNTNKGLRCAHRNGVNPNDPGVGIGFRVARAA